MSSQSNNQSEGIPLNNDKEKSSLPIVESRTQNHNAQESSLNNIQHMSSERIILEVKRLIKATSTPKWEKARSQQNWVAFHQELESEFLELKISYPAIFRLVIESGRSFDMMQLVQFLQLREQMTSGALLEDDAHKFVGQAMVDKYVIPNLPEDKRRK